MVSIGITPQSVEQVLKLGGKRYFLATQDEVSKVDGVRRAWDVRRVPRQDGDPEQEFTLPLTDFSQGYGFTFSGQSGVYEIADGWDLSAPGKATTWKRHTTGDAVTSLDYRGWLYYNAATGYFYMLRGSYAVKYLPDDADGTTWSILERHYFGANIVVAGRPAEFQGKLYVPLVDISVAGTETLARWHQLTTFNVPVTEVQTLTQSGTPTGGTFVLRFADGLTTTDTSAIAYNASAATMQTALRLIPGLEQVTVTRSGASNFVWTVTMTGAPSVLAGSSPPQFTLQTNSLTGGSTPTITPATTTAGTGDQWDRGPSSYEARTFCTWQKPTVGPVLVRANANKVSSCSTTPTTGANWGTEYEVGDTGAIITALTTIGRLLVVGKEDGLWTGDELSMFQNELSDIREIRSRQNCVGMRPYGGYLLVPHILGLIRWRPGASWRLVGAEQDGFFEGDRSSGWGSTVGLAPYGRYCYQTVNDTYDGFGVLASLQSGASNRGPLTPHMHQSFDGYVEDCAIVGIASQPIQGYAPGTWSDDNAVGTITWSNTSDAASESAYASAADGGTTHYLKGLNPNPGIPSAATIKGILLQLKKWANTDIPTTTFEYTGGAQSYVVPAGITSIRVDVRGAQGGGSLGGLGGRVQTLIAVTPGETLHIYVGGRPDYDATLQRPLTGGYNGGGDGGSAGFALTTVGAPGGGGASDIRQSGTALGNRVVVAGGGGAGGLGGGTSSSISVSGGSGGSGGGTTGGTGGSAAMSGFTTRQGGGGGTSSAGGNGPGDATNGSSGQGGQGGDYATVSGVRSNPGGGGGGGYYGGGGGEEGTLTVSTATTPTTFSPSAGGGGGSSYVSSGTGTVHTQGYQSGHGQVIIMAGDDTDVVDSVVKLVKAGSVTGDNKADTTTQWPNAATTFTYGGANDLWGTTWTPAQVNASDFGFVFSSVVTNGEARAQAAKLYVYYTVTGVQDPGSFLAVITLDSTRTVATPQIFKLPRSGQPVANDPNIGKAVSGKSFRTSRYTAPHRNVQKTYRSCEFDIDLDPEENTPGFQVWASVEDGDFAPLLDANGNTATVTASGAYELNFPTTAAAVGRWVQIEPRIPDTTGDEVGVSVALRDTVVHGSWSPKMTEVITAVLVLRQGIHQDGFSEQRTSLEQFDDLDSLSGPRLPGEGPIALHDPVRNEDTYCVVSKVSWKEVQFKAESAPAHVAIVELRKTPYDAS